MKAVLPRAVDRLSFDLNQLIMRSPRNYEHGFVKPLLMGSMGSVGVDSPLLTSLDTMDCMNTVDFTVEYIRFSP